MKKALCFALAPVFLLLLAACGQAGAPTPEPTAVPVPVTGTPAPTPEPTPEPTHAPEPEPDDPLERTLAFLRAQDGVYVGRHISTYLELYRMTHPGAHVLATGWSYDQGQLKLDLTGLDARAFADSGYLPDQVKVVSFGYANEFVPRTDPIPREPEFDRVSEQGVRVTMDRAEWPVGTEYVGFTMRNEGENDLTYGADVELQKYVEGSWKPIRHSGMILAIAYILSPGQEVSLGPPLSYFPALGEGLYRTGFIHDGVWAEFAVRAEAEPPEPRVVWRGSYPEAALLLAGLPDAVESELANKATCWPSLSSTWELWEERSFSDAELAALLLGEGAEYDASAESYRLGDRTLVLQEGAELEQDSLLVRALRLALPLADPEEADPGDIPALEQSGWVKRGLSVVIPPLDSLYPDILGTCYTPDMDSLNERLAAALEVLGEEAGELRDFRFAPEDLRDLWLLVVPVCTGGMNNAISLCSPYGELAGAAAWCIYRQSSGDSRELLALSAPLPGYSLIPGEQTETRSPLDQAEKFIPLLREEGLKLVSFDYVLLPSLQQDRSNTLTPWYRLRGVTAEGEERTWVVNAWSRGATAFELERRARLERLLRSGELRAVFQRCREQSRMDVWLEFWALDRREDGREYLIAYCRGVDVPILEASGVLPEGVAAEWIESPFNQKESHPCPREPEREKDWGTVSFTVARAAYPPYPEAVEVTVRCDKPLELDSLRVKKLADGEWRNVCSALPDTRSFDPEAGETALQVYPQSILGEGLYRLYVNEKFWVEFRVSADPEEPGAGPGQGEL